MYCKNTAPSAGSGFELSNQSMQESGQQYRLLLRIFDTHPSKVILNYAHGCTPYPNTITLSHSQSHECLIKDSAG